MADHSPSAGDRFQALAARALIGSFRRLSIDRASALGGWLARQTGPLSRAQRMAEGNLRRAFPGMADSERARILTAMWDNLGRTVGEYPHLARLAEDPERVRISGLEHLGDILPARKPVLFISAHYGNWELATVPLRRAGIRGAMIYRAANNPLADELIQQLRAPLHNDYYPKGKEGARAMLSCLRKGQPVGMLVDQRLGEGEAVDFFGQPAMTTTAPATMAHRLNIDIVPARVDRLQGAHFHLRVFPPLEKSCSGDLQADILETTRRINALLEDWIRDRPEQWFWVHNRWK